MSDSNTSLPAAKAELHFGFGELVVQEIKVGEFEFPGVAIYPAKQPGSVGSSAKREPTRIEDDDTLSKSVLLVFPTREQRDLVADALVNAIPQPEVNRLSDEKREAIQECINYLTPAAKSFSDLGIVGMGDSKHARCIRVLRDLLKGD